MKKILVVDDIEEYLRSLENALKDEYAVVNAVNLEEAKKVFLEEKIDGAVVDIRLSETDTANKDGLVFLEWVKMNNPDVKVIVMSAYKEFDLAVESLNLGAEYFLKKPINLSELKRVLKSVFKD